MDDFQAANEILLREEMENRKKFRRQLLVLDVVNILVILVNLALIIVRARR